MLDENLTVRPNENNEMAGVYWKDRFTGISMAKDGLKMQRDEGYCDYYLRPHKTHPEVIDRVKSFILDLNRPEFMELLMMDDYKTDEELAKEAAGISVQKDL